MELYVHLIFDGHGRYGLQQPQRSQHDMNVLGVSLGRPHARLDRAQDVREVRDVAVGDNFLQALTQSLQRITRDVGQRQ